VALDGYGRKHAQDTTAKLEAAVKDHVAEHTLRNQVLAWTFPTSCVTICPGTVLSLILPTSYPSSLRQKRIEDELTAAVEAATADFEGGAKAVRVSTERDTRSSYSAALD
jgi:hypothetical protein